MIASSSPLRAMAVVIPAHNEETLLGACLASVATAVASAPLPTVVVLVLDRCTDGSAAVAHAFRTAMPLIVVEGSYSGVGAVRDAGVTRARRCFAALPSSSVWVANTDADTVVGAMWLEEQRVQGDAGLDLLLGTVEPGPGAAGQDPALAVWFLHHELREGHGHVHGANLGIRLSELDRVGGFGETRVGEDAGVAARVRASNERWRATDATRVVTSSRRQGRAEDGFAAYLRRLDVSVGGAAGSLDGSVSG